MTNLLLAALSPKDRANFIGGCTRVQLTLGSVLHEQGDLIRHVYFPTESFISMLTTVDGNSTLEVGMIGNEGMCGAALILGDNIAPLRALVQGGGFAWRMKAATFRDQLEKMSALRALLRRYLQVLLRQLAQTAACTRFHIVEERLARWLLMTQDRAHADTFVVTQEFLAFMLGVRRVGVTEAAGALQTRGLISYKRGKITILRRDLLEVAACACYRSDIEFYARGLAPTVRAA